MTPRREPRPMVVHWLVDSAVAFLLIAFLAWIVGFPFWVIIVAALVLGAVATPFTRDLEARMLEDRMPEDSTHDDPGPEEPPPSTGP